VFGPRQSPHSAYAAVIPMFFQAVLEGRPAVVFGDGEQTRDFTYVDNVVDANLLAASAPTDTVSGWVANVGAGVRTSLLGLLEMISVVTGLQAVCVKQPPRSGDVRDSLASLERATRLFGYRPNVALKEGLRRTWDWVASSAPTLAGVPRRTPRIGLVRQQA